MPIRPYTSADLPALHAINVQCVPAVSAESEDSLGELLDMGTCFVAVDDTDTPLGFLNLIEPGEMRYRSDNLRWFETWMEEENVADMAYVDRIALAETARNQRIGEQLYDAVCAKYAERQLIGCEVNVDPPNPGSQRFHERLGFFGVGIQRYRPGYCVQFYVKPLAAKPVQAAAR